MIQASGYAPFRGGINNQKMALTAVFVDALRSKTPVVLPAITQFDQINLDFEAQPFGSVFNEDKLLAVAARYGISVIPEARTVSYARHYVDYFWQMYNLIETDLLSGHNPELDRFVGDILNALEPLVKYLPAMEQIRRAAARDTLAVQFRIEADWQDHCRDNLAKIIGPEEELYISFNDIIKKIKTTLPGTRKIFAMFDEAASPETVDFLRENCWNEHRIYITAKSDFLTSGELRGLKPVNLSLIDFEIALSAEIFVGTSRSTFANLAALQRHFMGKQVNHFIYNKRGPGLARRTDCGRHAAAAAATQ